MIYWMLKKLFPKLTMTRKESMETIKVLNKKLYDKKQEVKELRESNNELKESLRRTFALLTDMTEEIELEISKDNKRI